MTHSLSKTNDTRVQSWFTFALLASPLLNVYSANGIMLGMILMVLCLFISFIKFCSFKEKSFDAILLTTLIPVLVLSISSFFSTTYESNYSYHKIIGRIGLLLYYYSILFMCKYFFDIKKAHKTIRIFSLIIIICTALQLILYYSTGIILQLYIPGLDTTIEGLENVQVIDSGFFRPKSIFNEPSHIAYYLSLGLMVELFCAKALNKIWAIIYSVGLVLSVSGTGIIMLIIIWCLFLLSNHQTKVFFEILIGVILGVAIFHRIGLIDDISYSIGRVSTDSNRISGYTVLYSQLNEVERLFGIGMGNSTIRFSSYFEYHSSFMSGFGRTVVEGGLVSAVIYSGCYLHLLIKKRFPDKAFVVLFIIMNFIENTMFGIYFPLILAWVIGNRKTEKDSA